MECELCSRSDLSLLHQYQNKYNARLYNRVYYLCAECKFIFLQPSLRLNLEEEKHRYSQHNNSIEDHNYLKFLDKLVSKLSPYLKKTDIGLDYGCGPSIALAKHLSNQGFLSSGYDPFFFPSTSMLEKQYNFVTCTEAVEHFYQPLKAFKKINTLLKPGAYLGVMTRLYSDKTDFKTWHYHNDITHVSFYKAETMMWIAEKLYWKIISLSDQVIIFQKLVK